MVTGSRVEQALARELPRHVMKEEMVLVRYVCRVEEALRQKQPLLPRHRMDFFRI
jgi:hypothetical protein